MLGRIEIKLGNLAEDISFKEGLNQG